MSQPKAARSDPEVPFDVMVTTFEVASLLAVIRINVLTRLQHRERKLICNVVLYCAFFTDRTR